MPVGNQLLNRRVILKLQLNRSAYPSTLSLKRFHDIILHARETRPESPDPRIAFAPLAFLRKHQQTRRKWIYDGASSALSRPQWPDTYFRQNTSLYDKKGLGKKVRKPLVTILNPLVVWAVMILIVSPSQRPSTDTSRPVIHHDRSPAGKNCLSSISVGAVPSPRPCIAD